MERMGAMRATSLNAAYSSEECDYCILGIPTDSNAPCVISFLKKQRVALSFRRVLAHSVSERPKSAEEVCVCAQAQATDTRQAHVCALARRRWQSSARAPWARPNHVPSRVLGHLFGAAARHTAPSRKRLSRVLANRLAQGGVRQGPSPRAYYMQIRIILRLVATTHQTDAILCRDAPSTGASWWLGIPVSRAPSSTDKS